MKFTFPNVPVESLKEIAREARAHGLAVSFEECGTKGQVICAAGELQFEHDGQNFVVVITRNLGHFPRPMLVGGLRQLVEEGIERWHRTVEA